MMYLGWYDDSKQSVVEKIRGGIAAYLARFGIRPSVVLCNVIDATEDDVDGVQIQARGDVTKNNFWIGME